MAPAASQGDATIADPDGPADWSRAIDALRRRSLRMRLLIALFEWLAAARPVTRRRVGAVLGALAPWLVRRRIPVVRRNLALCFPELSAEARERLLKDHFRALAQSVVDRSVFWFGSAGQIRDMVHVHGHEQVAGLVERHGSVLLLAPHFIGLDAAATRLSIEGPAGAAMYSPQNSPGLDQLVRLGRSRFNAVHLVSRRGGVRALIRYIEAHFPIYYLPDMDFGRRGAVFVPFFGVPAATQTSTAQLAARWGLPVVPIICFWDPATGRYEVQVRAPLTDFPGDHSPEAATAILNRHLEAWVREAPAQYYWVHRRFKTRPSGEPSLY